MDDTQITSDSPGDQQESVVGAEAGVPSPKNQQANREESDAVEETLNGLDKATEAAGEAADALGDNQEDRNNDQSEDGQLNIQTDDVSLVLDLSDGGEVVNEDFEIGALQAEVAETSEEVHDQATTEDNRPEEGVASEDHQELPSKEIQFGESWQYGEGDAKFPELDVFGDASLRVRTLRNGGPHDSRPQNGERVLFDYRISLAGGEPQTIIERRGEAAVMGDADILFGIETALKFVEQGALVRAFVASRFAYGARGLPPSVPPNADLLVEIDLRAVEPPVDWRSADDDAKRAYAESKRERARFYESIGQLTSAAICLSRANAVEMLIAPQASNVTLAVAISTTNECVCDADDGEHVELEQATTPIDAKALPQAEAEAEAVEGKATESASAVSFRSAAQSTASEQQQAKVSWLFMISSLVLLAAFAAAWFRSRTSVSDE